LPTAGFEKRHQNQAPAPLTRKPGYNSITPKSLQAKKAVDILYHATPSERTFSRPFISMLL
jgi:hypothetical protein